MQLEEPQFCRKCLPLLKKDLKSAESLIGQTAFNRTAGKKRKIWIDKQFVSSKGCVRYRKSCCGCSPSASNSSRLCHCEDYLCIQLQLEATTTAESINIAKQTVVLQSWVTKFTSCRLGLTICWLATLVPHFSQHFFFFLTLITLNKLFIFLFVLHIFIVQWMTYESFMWLAC